MLRELPPHIIEVSEMKELRQAFIKPDDEFTPFPLWFWNDDVTAAEIERQLFAFKEKGVTGFILHPRMGLSKRLSYLSDSFMTLVQFAVETAKREGMQVILYDEGMYPSGSANGEVVRQNQSFASKGIAYIEQNCKQGMNVLKPELQEGEELLFVGVIPQRITNDVKNVSILIPEEGDGAYRFNASSGEEWMFVWIIEGYTQGTIRGVHPGEDDGEPGAPRSADLLNPKAVQAFISLTHERYKAWLSDYFGKTVIAMFTDEPDIVGRQAKPGMKPWTSGLLSDWKARGLKERDLLSLWIETKDCEKIRTAYSSLLHDQLQLSYYKQLSDWCESNGIALTGHPAESDDMSLLDTFHIPGQDLVWRWVSPDKENSLTGSHSVLGKSAADAARHRGRRRNLNEVLGACGRNGSWHLPLDDVKWYLDWLFVRGVNMIVPHAFYYSIRGRERSHERPPDIGLHSGWWPFFGRFSQYIKRMSWLLTDSTNHVEIAVLCTDLHVPWKVVKPLYENQVEFHYLESSFLHEPFNVFDRHIHVREHAYRVLIIDEDLPLSDSLISSLHQVADAGVLVLTRGDRRTWARRATTDSKLIEILEEMRPQRARLIPTNDHIRLAHVRKMGKTFFIVSNEGESFYKGSIFINETGYPEAWSPWEGTMCRLEYQKSEEGTTILFTLNRRELVVITMNPEQELRLPLSYVSKEEWETGRLLTSWSADRIFNNEVTQLVSWTDITGFQTWSGTVTYQTVFDWDPLPNERELLLDLGEVYEIAEVHLNGKKIGVGMWQPYIFTVNPMLLKQTSNRLTVSVTNSKACEMDQIPFPSGLLGPVQINVRKQV
ncbi:hypothetical protein FLK61_23450 [Paenalkalicoccus suaedae]|uniref:Glycosyl hydrolases family 2 sugar binding domain-containing protein n=1 Tax=Paenalkalicoccus suaedae TaxID=2592382 RepID=A0A859FB41_9BACI|nr:glycosylhydrolase-like jelly roll fold domain-containing protein [Paenalkalicoccus suaedae]QKS69754.1 hypothetical protein FLK61_23450 [Paenalkalicoccus suaedae]